MTTQITAPAPIQMASVPGAPTSPNAASAVPMTMATALTPYDLTPIDDAERARLAERLNPEERRVLIETPYFFIRFSSVWQLPQRSGVWSASRDMAVSTVRCTSWHSLQTGRSAFWGALPWTLFAKVSATWSWQLAHTSEFFFESAREAFTLLF